MAYPYQPQPSASAPMPAVPSVVIGSQYCAPYPVDLAVVKKLMTIADGSFAVTDINGNIVFKVKGSVLSLRDRRVLVDAAGYPIVTLRRKVSLSLIFSFSISNIKSKIRKTKLLTQIVLSDSSCSGNFNGTSYMFLKQFRIKKIN